MVDKEWHKSKEDDVKVRIIYNIINISMIQS